MIGLSDSVNFDEDLMEVIQGTIWGKGVTGRGNHLCQASEVRTYLLF